MMFKETDIYKFDVPGIGEVNADPLRLRRGLLLATSGRCWEWAQRAKEFEDLIDGIPAVAAPGEEEKVAAQRAEWSTRLAELEGLLVKGAYLAFGFAPIDPATGEGQTEGVVLGVLQDFLEWIEQKKSAPVISPTPSSTLEAGSPGAK